MYKLTSKSVDFNLPYMILTKMIFCCSNWLYALWYFTYSLLFFEHFHCDINAHPHFYVNHSISDKTSRAPLPLPDYSVQPDTMIQFGSLPHVNVVYAPLSAQSSMNTMPIIIDDYVDVLAQSATTSVNAMLDVVSSHVEPNKVPTVVPTSSPTHAQLVAYFTVLVKLSAKCKEIDTNYKDLKTKFEALNGKFT